MFGSRTHSISSYEVIATKTYKWKSTKKQFYAWDADKKEEVALPNDAKLIPLTSTYSITGAHGIDLGKPTQRYNNIYSNEFNNFKEEHIVVKEYDRVDKNAIVLAEGVYNPTIKQFVSNSANAKFTTNVYCLYNGEVVKILMCGASLSPWIDLLDNLKEKSEKLTDNHYFYISGTEEAKTGAVVFNKPVFAIGDITPEENEQANTIAEQVEEKIMKNKGGEGDFTNKIGEKTAEVTEEKTETVSLSEIPF